MGVAAAAGELKEGLIEAPKNLIKHPLFVVGLIIGVTLLVLLVEAFKPGIITGPLKRALGAVGVKSA